MKVLVVNSSPLITLAKSDLLHLLIDSNHKIIIPADVFAEVMHTEKNDAIHKYFTNLEKFIHSEYSITADVKNWGLGKGESSVISSARNIENSFVVIDDLEARRCARFYNLNMIGTLGIILTAKKENKIKSAKDAIQKLLYSGLYLDQGLIEKVLRESVNEEWERI